LGCSENGNWGALFFFLSLRLRLRSGLRQGGRKMCAAVYPV